MPSLFPYNSNQAAGAAVIAQKIRIGLVQINNSFSGQCYLPYSVGLLQAHLVAKLRDPERVAFLLPLYRRMRVEAAVEQLADADIVLFSAYVWNLRISTAIAERLKALKPATQIVFGGPQVPNISAAFMAAHPYIDVIIQGEGEAATLQLIENCENADWRVTPGISYRDPEGNIIQNPRGARIADLSRIASPYLSGTFRPLLNAFPDQKWIALWETNRGCPFSCTFCDWGSATTGKVCQFDLERIFREADWFSENKIEFIFCCDANFGLLKRDIEIARYVSEKKKTTGYPQALSVQNTKNATERTYLVQKELGASGLNKGVTLSMQSMDKTTLESVNRANISSRSFQELQRRFTRERVETYGDLILALPGETYDSFVNGVSELIESGQHNRIQFNNLAILPNAPIAAPESMLQHGLIAADSDIINIHGSLVDSDQDIVERQQLAIATKTMPANQWVRTRAFCWMTALLHFDKVVQIPIIIARGIGGFSYREILEFFTEGNLSRYPVLARVRDFFRNFAREIQNGGPEYVRSERYLNIFWPADEFILIQLIADREIGAFYDEVLALLKTRLEKTFASQLPALEDAVHLNRALLKIPFQKEDLSLHLRYNVWEHYQGVLAGDEVPLEERPSVRTIDRSSVSWWSWDEYCREVIWYGNKKGAYLYTQKEVAPQIAGIY